MMSLLAKKLGLGKQDGPAASVETELGRSLRRILPDASDDTLSYLAAFGGLLGRVALADLEITPDEDARIRAILQRFAKLGEREAEVVETIVHQLTRALAGVENQEYIREINRQADHAKKLEIVSCLFAVAAADGEIGPEENNDISLIAKGLLLGTNDFISIRSLYREYLSFLKDLPK